MGKLSYYKTFSKPAYMVLRGVWGPPFKSVFPSNSGSPVIQGSKFPHASLSILHMIPKNNPHGKMDEGHIWVWSTLQTNRKQNESNREDFEQ